MLIFNSEESEIADLLNGRKLAFTSLFHNSSLKYKFKEIVIYRIFQKDFLLAVDMNKQ